VSAGLLVALGDSITAAQDGWAGHLARTLGLELVNLAQDGQIATGVVAEQVPQLAERAALASLFIGANDARSTAWDAEAFAGAVRTTLDALAPRAARLLVLTVPSDLGRPWAGPDALEASALLRREAARAGAAVAELADLGGWRFMRPDHVHPTPLGQLEIARRAARALGEAEPVADVRPPPPPERARELVRDLSRRVRERAAVALGR
jgi:lysophospholipase L1-like esterase